MFCRQCGNKIEDGKKVCSQCGAKARGIDIHISKKAGIGFGVICLSVIGITVGSLAFQNPTYTVIKLIDENNLEDATQIYSEKIEGNESKEEKLELKLEKKIEDIQIKFLKNQMTYDECKQRLEIIEKIDVNTSNLEQVKNTINKLNDSRVAYEKAKGLIDSGAYADALKELKNVIKEDENYQNAQQMINETSEKYEKNVIEQIDNKISNKKYEDAGQMIDEALLILIDNTELKEKKNSISKQLEEVREQKRKQEAEEARKAQLISVSSAKVVSQSSQWKALYPDMIQVIVKNNSNQTVKSMVISSLAFDNNGLPIKIKGQYNFGNIDYEYLGNAEDVNILPGNTFGNNMGWALDETHGITYVLSCVKEATFYDGETWSNPYYSYWKQAYSEKELPDSLK